MSHSEQLSLVTMREYQEYTRDQFINMVTNEFDKVETDFGKTHGNIRVSFILDDTRCYYPGDAPEPALKFEGDRN